MYRKFFELKEHPFSITPDPSFVFLTVKHEEALSCLLFGIKQKKGFMEITGEVGTGKTTLCRLLLGRLDKNINSALILNVNLPELQFLEAVITDLGIHCERRTKICFINGLNDFLLEEASAGRITVLIIDEAQDMKPAMLEHIRLLSNLETEKEKLLQIVLVGQPELRNKLNSAGLRQLRQRISVRYNLKPLEPEEVNKYIRHRMKVAGWKGEDVFQPDAIDEIMSYSQGIPRLVNVVCDRSLLLAFVREQKKIPRDMILDSIREIENVERVSIN